MVSENDSARCQCFEFGEFRLDRRSRVLTNAAGRRIEITDTAFDALVYLLEHPGVVIGRSTLLDALWPDTVVEENNLSQAVAQLRRALGDGYIATVRRKGYQFVHRVRAATDVGADDARERSRRVPRFAHWTLNHLGRDGESVNPAHPGQAKRRRRPSRAPPQGDLLI